MELLKQWVDRIEWDVILFGTLRILLVLFIAWIVLRVARHILHRIEQELLERYRAEGESSTESSKRVETISRLVRQAIRLAVWIVVLLVILRQVGVEIGPILGGAGILGLAVGFGAQNIVRDVISGFFFLLENQVRVGDVAVVNGTGGLVESINFRTIVLRDLSGTVHVFPNGTVTTLANLTRGWSAYVFEIGVAYKEDADRVIELLRQVLVDMKVDPHFGRFIVEDPEVFGVDKLADSAVVIKGRIKTRPIQQWAVGREFLRRTKKTLDENGVEIPFPHRTLYFGEASKPFDIKLLEQLQSNGEVRASREESSDAS